MSGSADAISADRDARGSVLDPRSIPRGSRYQAKKSPRLLEQAIAHPDILERIAILEEASTLHPNGDALPEAWFRLAEAYREVEDIDQARAYYSKLLRTFPDSIWRRPAEDRIAVLPAMVIASRAQMLAMPVASTSEDVLLAR